MGPSFRSSVLLVGLAFGAAIGAHSMRAEACSCAGVHAVALSPALQAGDVPRNARVRALVPVEPDQGGRLILRQRKGAEIATTERRAHQGAVDLVELLPIAPLAARAEYEILVRNEAALPPNHVIGFFTTGADSDTTPPVLDRDASVHVEGTGRGVRSTCDPREPYVMIEVSGKDDRAGLLLFGVWVAKNGRFAFDEPPDAIGEGARGLSLGKSSVCSLADYAFPEGGGPIAFAVAAIDTAGNRSPPRRFDVVVPSRRR